MAPEPLIRLVVVLDDLARSREPEYAPSSPWVIPGSVYQMPVQVYGADPQPSRIVQDIQRDVRLGLLCKDAARVQIGPGLIGGSDSCPYC